MFNLGLIRLNHNNAIHLGDGERVMKLMKFICLYFKIFGCPKYAYGTLETIANITKTITKVSTSLKV